MGGYFQIDSSGYDNSFIMAYNGNRWCLISFGISIYCNILYVEVKKESKKFFAA